MVNSAAAVPVSETIASVCLPTDRVSRYSAFRVTMVLPSFTV